MSFWLPFLIAFCALSAIVWFAGPDLVSRCLSVAYKFCYAAGGELPLAYALGSISHEIGIAYLRTRLDRHDLRIIPAFEQAAVLFNAQARYREAERMYVEAQKVYAFHLSSELRPGQQKIDRNALTKCYANMVLDHSSMLEIENRMHDAKRVLQDGATIIDLAGQKEIAAGLREKSKTISER